MLSIKENQSQRKFVSYIWNEISTPAGQCPFTKIKALVSQQIRILSAFLPPNSSCSCSLLVIFDSTLSHLNSPPSLLPSLRTSPHLQKNIVKTPLHPLSPSLRPYLLPSSRVFSTSFINSQPAAFCRTRETKKQKTSRVKMTRSPSAEGIPIHCDMSVGRLQACEDRTALIY